MRWKYPHEFHCFLFQTSNLKCQTDPSLIIHLLYSLVGLYDLKFVCRLYYNEKKAILLDLLCGGVNDGFF